MTAATATPLLDGPTTSQALDELGKFFAIAALADEAPGMFSAYIDAAWHQLAETPDYADFCVRAAGVPVTHDATCGEGTVVWLDLYHAQFGALPAVWFADENGAVDSAAYASYIDTQTVRGCWNCTATTGDPDYAGTSTVK